MHSAFRTTMCNPSFLSGPAFAALLCSISVSAGYGYAAPNAAPDVIPEDSIRWLSGTAQLAELSAEQVQGKIADLAGRPFERHIVVQLRGLVDARQRAQWELQGLKLLDYLGSNAFFAVVSDRGVDTAAIARAGKINRVAPIDRLWKLHPELLKGVAPAWAVVQEVPEDKSSDSSIVGAYIVFHPDVKLFPDAIALAQQHGATVRDQLESVNGLVIELPFGNIPALADEDAVQWIEPPLPRFDVRNDSNRAMTGADIVQAPPYSLNGAGVTVLVYDAGYALASHADFGGRLTVRDTSGLIDHATHVSGTIGGNGASSGGTYKGMAPGVTIQSYGFEDDGTGIFLYSNPGDIETDYTQAINVYGADISNNSIGTNTCWNGFPCSITGDYGVTSALIDAIVAGSLGAPFRITWANGNERSCTGCPTEHQNGYHSTAPPACMKNALTVGALNSNDDSMTDFSSWGPCDDGRIKPDVSAPGCQSNGDEGVTSTSSSGGYTVMCGTSMASPTVCGLGALMLQDYRIQHPGDPDFRNSTLRAVLAHTAVDRGNAGPDYAFGYGSVRVQSAIDLMHADNFLEGQVSQGGTHSMLVVVGPSDTTLRVTLAWDDVPAAANVTNALVNDLDLVVYDPSSNQQFPWTLNPASPSTPAVRTQADHVNNIEQVYVAAPAPGAWRIEVRGFNVPQGPQSFSLCASPNLLNCSSQGNITLDRPKYACASSANIQVIDCDLNTDDLVIETVSVTIASSTEPAGETVLLTETAAATAAFRGTIALSMTDGAGVLHIAAGDTVTASYIDADDGQGGTNVLVQTTATVDCVSPTISNVQTSGVGPFTATVTFDTNELAQGTVRFGTSCGALSGSASGAGYNTAHSIGVSGLMENTTYYFAVDAADEAGNATTDDNGGSCYTFATPDIPNYFTEEFTSDHDLDNVTLTFSPDGSFEYYSACIEPISALPVDPTGGSTISGWSPTSDDGFVSRTLTGGATVSIYGDTYDTFFVSTNGSITFGTGDSEYTESLTGHFAIARVAALFDDLDPGSGGTVSWKQLSDRAVVTWQNVPEYNSTSTNTFQIDLGFDGTIRISNLVIAATDGIVGLSAGDGMPSPFFETDLSAAGSCGPRPPVAGSSSVSTPVSTPVLINLTATDDGLPVPPGAITYEIRSLPAHGSLSDPQAGAIGSVPYTLANGGNQATFSPHTGYQGGDSFTFGANDGGTPPGGGASNTATVSLTIGGPQVIHSFPMDTNPGWTMTGQWQFGVPTGGGSHNFDPTAGHTGTNVIGYNLAGDYPDAMPQYFVTTTPINCTGATNTELRFWRWLGVESSTYDHANVQVSNNGSTWTTLWDHSGGSFSDSAWTQHVYDISAVADGQSAVLVRWGMGTTDGSVTYPGWNIDDVEIFGITSVADCNQNGVPDGEDISGGTSQDCNGNGVPDECEGDLSPTISTQPANQGACEGASATLSVVAGGTPPLQFQWRKGGSDIPGATASSLVLSPITVSSAGSYDVVVTNACGSRNSSPATLTVTMLSQCNDGNTCTADTCSAGVCGNTPQTGAPCNDNNACTTNDACNASGACTGSALNCSDSNPCTTDTCDTLLGCQHADNTAACSDGDACTVGDLCSGGVCVAGSAAICNDSNACTDDSCLPASGCVYSNNTAPCNDGVTCTTNDTCAGGVCSGTPVVILFGDLTPPPSGNGIINLDDLLCSLSGFSSLASCPGADLVPCGGNGSVTIDDILAELGAFGGNYSCPHPCPP